MRPRTRRWIRRGLIGFAALLVSAVALTLIVLHTSWGREQLRRRAVAMLRETFPGGVEIGRIDGSVLGDLDVYDVVLDDASGRPAITADHLRVNLGILSLLGGESELETLDASGVAVLVVRPGMDVPRTRVTALQEWLGQRPSAPFLEVAVHIEPVTIVSDQLRGEVRGNFQLAIGDDGASVDGRIGVSRGKVILFDRRYGIQRADLAFDGGIDPLLDIQLEYDFPQLTMHVSLQGRLSKPTLHLSSDPNTYTEGELLAVLLGGAPGAPGTVARPASVAGVAAAAATQLVGGLVARKLPVRIDVINYEAVTSESSSAFVLGRWVSPTILVLLRGRVEPRPDENANEVAAEVWLNPRLVFEGVAGDRGVLGADLLWNRRW